MINWKGYFICSVIGANIAPILMLLSCGLISFLVWDSTALVFWFEKFIEAYTTEKFRALIISWLIFGNLMYLGIYGD